MIDWTYMFLRFVGWALLIFGTVALAIMAWMFVIYLFGGG